MKEEIVSISYIFIDKDGNTMTGSTKMYQEYLDGKRFYFPSYVRIPGTPYTQWERVRRRPKHIIKQTRLVREETIL